MPLLSVLRVRRLFQRFGCCIADQFFIDFIDASHLFVHFIEPFVYFLQISDSRIQVIEAMLPRLVQIVQRCKSQNEQNRGKTKIFQNVRLS